MAELSIIIAVLDSHEVVKRQLFHFEKMNLPDEVEFIIVDDGSIPPLKDYLKENVKRTIGLNYLIIETNDQRKWSQPCARNTGAHVASSERLLMTDIDHVLSKEAIEFCLQSDADKVMFPRHWAVLDEGGGISQSPHVLHKYGLPKKIWEERKFNGGMHHNTFMMQKKHFMELDGYDEKFCGKYGGDDTDFAYRYSLLVRDNKATRHILGPSIFVFPDPNRDVQKIFHSLRR